MKKETRKSEIFSGIFWKMSERVLAQLTSFIISIVLARILLPEEYGIVSMVIVFISVADVFVTSGYNAALIQKKDADDTDFSTMFYCSATTSIMLCLILYFAAPYISKFYDNALLTSVIRILSLKLIINSYNTIQHAYVSKNMMFKKFFFSTLFGTIVSGIVGIIIAYKGGGVWALVSQYLINSLIDSIVLSFTIPWKPKLLFSKDSASNLIRYGSKILATDLSGTIFDQLRSLLIAKMYTPAELAYYNKGKQIPSLVNDNITSTIMSVLFPAFSHETDKVKMKVMVKKAMRSISYVLYPAIFGCIVIARPLVLVLLTQKWERSIIIMQLLCCEYLITLIGNLSLQVVKACGRGDVLLKIEFYKKPVFFILLVIGAYISIECVAITGVIYALYATIINSCAMSKIINYNLKEQISDMIKPIFISMIMAIILYLLKFIIINIYVLLVVQVIAGIVLYILMSKYFKLEEYGIFKEYIKNYLWRKR